MNNGPLFMGEIFTPNVLLWLIIYHYQAHETELYTSRVMDVVQRLTGHNLGGRVVPSLFQIKKNGLLSDRLKLYTLVKWNNIKQKKKNYNNFIFKLATILYKTIGIFA